MILQQMPLRVYGYFVVLFAVGCALHFAAAENETAWMPDEDLRAAVRKALGLATDVSLTPSRLERLTELQAVQPKMRSLKGLEYATRLEVLNLWWSRVIDITPLANLTGLKTLNLVGNEISNISVLTQLTNLEVLHIRSNPIQDVTPLRTLKENNPQITIYE